MLNLPPAYVAIIVKLILSLLSLALTLVASRALRNLLAARFRDTPHAHTGEALTIYLTITEILPKKSHCQQPEVKE